MLEIAIDIFGRIDYSSKLVWLVLGILFGGVLLVAGLLVFIMYKAKLIIPKSKLFDDEFIQASQRNYQRFLSFWRILAACLGVVLTFVLSLHLAGLWDAFEPPLQNGVIFLVSLFLISLPFALGTGRRPGRKEDILRQVKLKRQLHDLNKQKPSPVNMKGWLLIIGFFSIFFLILIGTLFLRGMGMFGLLWRLITLGLGTLAALWAGLSLVKDVLTSVGRGRLRIIGSCFAVTLWLSAAAWLTVLCLQDMAGGPAVVQAEVISFTGRYLCVSDIETGEYHSIRINSWERYFTLKELWLSWKDSRAFYGDTIMRITNTEKEDKPLYCRITFYPRTGYRVRIEDIEY